MGMRLWQTAQPSPLQRLYQDRRLHLQLKRSVRVLVLTSATPAEVPALWLHPLRRSPAYLKKLSPSYPTVKRSVSDVHQFAR